LVNSATKVVQLAPAHSQTCTLGARVPSNEPVTGGSVLTIGGRKKKCGVPPECAPSLKAKLGGGTVAGCGAIASPLQPTTKTRPTSQPELAVSKDTRRI